MKSSRPRRRRRWFIAILLTGAMALLYWHFFGRSTEPAFEGKTLTEWLVIATDVVGEKSDIAADTAIQRIGSNAIPTLLEKLTAEDPFWQPIAKPWNWLISQTTPIDWYPTLSINEWRASENHKQALHGFAVLGTNGNSAVPRLAALLHDDRFAGDAAEALNSIHTEQALAAFVTGLTNADARMRYSWLVSAELISYDLGATSLVRWADQIAALRTDPNEEVANGAARLLLTLFPEERAVPMLLEMLHDANPTLQLRALGSFLIGPESAMESIAHSISSLVPSNRVAATNVLIFMNVYRASELGVNTNGLDEAHFVRQNNRQAAR